MQGASQIKLMAGGGVASLYDPLDSTQFTRDEVKAAVEAAEDWGTYVTVHVYMPKGIKRCIDAGVRCIEHGQLADEEAAMMMADRGIWWSLQPFIASADANRFTNPDQQAKQQQVFDGTDIAYGFATKHKVRIGFGSDILFNAASAARQGSVLASTARWFTPAQALKAATADNGELLALSGERSTYRGKLGVIEKDAFADILLVDGDPTSNRQLLADPDRNMRVIMKDGRIHKNTL